MVKKTLGKKKLQGQFEANMETNAIEEFIKRSKRKRERLLSPEKQAPQNFANPQDRIREVLERSIVLKSYEWRSK
jgi:hypothetical protein